MSRVKNDRCKHFTGYQNLVCEAGVTYRTLVGGPLTGWLGRLPCLLMEGQHDQAICERFELPTAEELAESERRAEESTQRFTRALEEGRCPHCEQPVARERQVGPCVYAEPCGHRMYQGHARLADQANGERGVMTCHCETDLNALAVHGRDDFAPTWEINGRGFVIGTFRDLYGQECTIQESSSAEHDAIWLGVGGCRMHLTSDQALDLLSVLEKFAEDSDLRAFTRGARPSPTGQGEGA